MYILQNVHTLHTYINIEEFLICDKNVFHMLFTKTLIKNNPLTFKYYLKKEHIEIFT